MKMIRNSLHWASRLLLAAVFIYTGYIKVQAPLQFAVAITGYKLVPENLIWPIANYFPWLEIALGLALLIGWKIRYFSLGAVGLLLFFTVLLLITYFRGINANCGCFSFDDPISLKTIFRDALLLVPALFLAFETHLRARSKARSSPAAVGPAAIA
jgi:uncharacterized membrane protein YphA (DoxX/SURF4 family)